MINTFVCADLHFFHKNILKYENRPFQDVDDMNKQLIKRWNSVVKKDDIVYVLGDVSFGGTKATRDIVSRLNGRKMLIMGNHDRGRSIAKWLDIGFEWVSPHPVILGEFVVLMHEPPQYFNDSCPYFYVYGHVHGTPDYQSHTEHSACVSIERLNYTPALLDDVISGAAYTIGKELPNGKEVLENIRTPGDPGNT